MLARLTLPADGRRAINPTTVVYFRFADVRFQASCSGFTLFLMFMSFVTNNPQPIFKANWSAQYVDDIGFAAHTLKELIENNDIVCLCIDRAGLKLSMDECSFGQSKIQLLGKAISYQGINPNERKIHSILNILQLSTTVKWLQCYIGFVNFYRRYIPNLAEKLIPLYGHLQRH